MCSHSLLHHFYSDNYLAKFTQVNIQVLEETCVRVRLHGSPLSVLERNKNPIGLKCPL
jgi:hypothetical protein